MLKCLTLVLIALSLTSIHAEAETKKQLEPEGDAHRAPIIAAFGDSLMAGYGLPSSDALPAQLKVGLQADGVEVTMLNDGISGDTTADGKARISRVLDQHPNLVMILFGGNDLLRGLSASDAHDNLDAMMSSFEKAHIKMLLIGMTAPASLGPAYTGLFDGMYPELAKKHHAAFYPAYLSKVFGNDTLMQADGIHPNRFGVAAVVHDLEPELLSLIKQ